MSLSPSTGNTHFLWEPRPAATQFVVDRLDQLVAASPWLRDFRRRLLEQTGTRLFDWIDHLIVDDDQQTGLREMGFVREPDGPAWSHPGALLPRVLLEPDAGLAPCAAIKVERLDDFLAANQLGDNAEIQGPEGAASRVAAVDVNDGGPPLRVVERHGDRGFTPRDEAPAPADLRRAASSFAARERGQSETEGFTDAKSRFDEAAARLGPDRSCDLFFAAERDYWQSRNRAAQIQYARQQQLGLGWANHDHHTYRGSRERFASLVRCLEAFGFECRERFYAGSEAGWGAQVLEHPRCGIVVFADVDLSEDEVSEDFAHRGLLPRQEVGTVGLWCRLHGDSFFSAGMHHLECQFDFDVVRSQLAARGVATMDPFTDFPYLKQAFTQGEVWPVDAARIESLLEAGQVTASQARKFAAEGAIGSHLEILERNDGYKGFNQSGISQIILRTDPRNAS